MIEGQKNDTYYYNISVSYEIPYNILDSEVPEVVQAREELYDTLSSGIPEKYEKFSVKLILYQLQDTFNYIVAYTSFFRSHGGLPMEEYVEAEKIKEKAQTDLEDFFEAVDCEYRRINIKTLN